MEVMMLKKCMIFLLALLLLISAGTVFGAEMAKEGSDTVKTGFIATFQVLAQGKEYLQWNYVANGVVQTENEASPLYMSSTHCVGSLKAIKGEYKEIGLCTYNRPDGSQIYGSYEGIGKLGQGAKGSFTFVGGTEKLVGITGGGEWTRTSLKDPAKGVAASISKFTFNWKIPSE
jgi:hypothetical protein